MALVREWGHKRYKNDMMRRNGCAHVYWEEEGLEEVDLGGASRLSASKAGLLRGRLRLSRVTPLPSFVTPTTGGSPLWTNSQSPVFKWSS